MKAEDDDGDGDDGDPFDGDGSDDANSPWRQKGYQLPWHERNGEGGGEGALPPHAEDGKGGVTNVKELVKALKVRVLKGGGVEGYCVRLRGCC